MFWKRKKKHVCEHEWKRVCDDGGLLTEVYCPKCQNSRELFYDEANSLIRKSELRQEYLKTNTKDGAITNVN